MLKTIRVVTLVSIAIAFLITAAYYTVLPDTVPAHFDREGRVTRYGSRLEVFFISTWAAVGQGLLTLILIAAHPYIVVQNPNMSALTAKKVTLAGAVFIASNFTSISIIAIYYMYNAALQIAVPPLIIGIVYSAMLATLSSIASGGYRYGFAVIALGLLTLGLLQLVHLGILAAISVVYAGLCCYHFVRHIRPEV